MNAFRKKKEIVTKLVTEPWKKRNQNEMQIARRKYASFINKYEIKENQVFYEAYSGRGMLGSPFALFEHFKKRDDFSRYMHIWSIEDLSENSKLVESMKKYPNVFLVERHSEEYLKYLATSKFLINNSTFHYYFMKREGQIYLNTWHGIPVKTLGFDIPNGAYASANVIKNFLSCDYLVSPNSHMNDIYLKSYRLDGIYKNKILHEGLPRNDFYYTTDRDDMLQKLEDAGVAIDRSKKIIVYAPTFRGRFGKPENRTEEYCEFLQKLTEGIDTASYQIFIKPHYAEFKVLEEVSELAGKLIPLSIDANQLLKVTDILVSDYSSIFFDYLISEKPVLFYIPDLEKYSNDRGILYKIEDLPGPTTKDIVQIVDWINHIDEIESKYKPEIRKLREEFCPHDDGNTSNRILDLLLENKQVSAISSELDNKKIKLLFYIGMLKTNGVTVSLMSLLNLLDMDKYDVTVYFSQNKEKNGIFRLSDFNENVRMLARVSTYNATTTEEYRHGLITQLGLTRAYCEKIYPKKLYENEFRRCFGDTQFDYIIDFAGYGSFFPRIMLGAKHSKTLIWQHNNLPKDRNRVVDGVKPFEVDLKVVFSLYKKIDKIVGCSKNVMEINRKTLATQETYNKFTYAKNTIHVQRILEGIAATQILTRDEQDYILLDDNHSNGMLTINKMLKVPKKDTVNFCTTGRMSVEKNQMNLLKAFAKLYKENKQVRLYLIGDGPLRAELEEYVQENGLDEVVIFTGNISNPFQLVKKCDCFVLPSKWEGQALVALETRVIGIPLIISNHAGYEAVCIENGQYVTETKVASIYEGLKAFIDGKVPTTVCDYNKYNQDAVKEFEALLD